jgi:flagellar assembly protein FliH
MSEAAFARVSLVDARAPARAFSPLRARTLQGSIVPTVPDPVAEPDLFAAGFAEGERAAGETFAAERSALLRLVAAADAFQPEPSEELAAMIATTVERLVTELVCTMPVEQTWLSERIDKAMTCLSEADAARTLWLHPDDMALLGDAELPLQLQPDPGLERGALRIDCSNGWIEDSRSLHLEALRTTLGIEARS